jgi:hypothetical protein
VSLPIPDPEALWRWLPWGYLMTAALEAPVLMAGLGPTFASRLRCARQAAQPGDRRYAVRQRLAAALWLTAVTYPIVAVALPLLLWPRASYATYVVVAESFAIVVECALFRAAWRGTPRDLVVVALANVVSATAGSLIALRMGR